MKNCRLKRSDQLKKRSTQHHIAIAGCLLIGITGCGGSEESPNQRTSALDPATIDVTPVNPNASPNTRSVLAYLGALSSDSLEGVIVGQQAGHGNQIADPSQLMGHKRMVESLYSHTGKWVGILGLDYGHDKKYTAEELSAGNQVLIDHWNQGGLVTVHWSAMNPWEPTTPNRTADVDISQLLNPSTPQHSGWREQLDLIANALSELQDAGVVVLWRPMQEMNGEWFWWGAPTKEGPSVYRDLYRDLYNYFTLEKGLNNLLWVYSPNGTDHTFRAVNLDYPGDNYVDIIGATTYNDLLDIVDYQDYLAFNKPLGVAEFGAASWKELPKTGALDNLLYRERIQSDYPAMGYWVSWHDWDWGNGTTAQMSIISNKNSNELMNHSDVLTRDKLQWREK